MKIKEEGLHLAIADEFMAAVMIITNGTSLKISHGVRLNDLFINRNVKMMDQETLEIQFLQQNQDKVLWFPIASIDDVLTSPSMAQRNFYKQIFQLEDEEFKKCRQNVAIRINAGENTASILMYLCKKYDISISQSKYLLDHVKKSFKR